MATSNYSKWVNPFAFKFNRLHFSAAKVAICATLINSCLPYEAVKAATYESSQYGYSYQYPDDFELSPKLLKTHEHESFLKSKDIKGFNVGLTVKYT